MTSTQRSRVVAPGVILLALIGVWITHTVEYTRVTGSARLSAGVLASVHVYMLPVGAALALGAAVMGVQCWRAWWALGRRLEQTRSALARAWRGDRGGAPAAAVGRPPSDGAQVVALWLPLTVLQIGLYLLQENGEALVAGRPAPGLGAVAGAHLLVIAVHLLVALAVAGTVLAVLRRLGERHGRVVACERLLLVLLRALGRAAVCAPAARTSVPSPLDRFGRHLLRRPPPRLLPV
jgi:hypothetical protein